MSIYNSLDFFMLRTPILSYENFFEFCELNDYETAKNKILEYIEQKKLLEPIAVASDSLYKSILSLKNEKSPKKVKHIINNFIKYLIRMTARPTPFGLFAGVTVGKFEDKTNIVLDDIKSFKKHIRPDMQWIMSLVSKIENDINLLKHLKVRVNSMVDIVGNRAVIPYTPEYGSGELLSDKNIDMTNKSIRFTEPVKLVYNKAQDFISYSELLDILLVEYQMFMPSQIEEFLFNLLKSDFLISELRPPLMIESPFDYICQKLLSLDEIHNISKTLIEIRNLLNIYENTAIGDGIYLLENLLEEMNKITKIKTQIQVDVTLKTKQCIINSEIAKEAKKVLEVLCKLSPDYSMKKSYLKSYREDFLEKYGTSREVPVLELLDEDRGIGVPATYKYPPGRREYKPEISSFKITPMEEYVLKKLLKEKNTYEIIINDEIIDSLYSKDINWEDKPVSTELYFLISSESKEHIDKGEYEMMLAPNPGSYGAGKTFGRFMYYFDEEIIDKLENINKLEQAHHPDTILAELVYLPVYERAANVAISKNIRDYEVVIGTNSSKSDICTIPLTDLLIGATHDSFYIKSKKFNKRVILKTGHMLNPAGAPNIYKFLLEISSDGYDEWNQSYFNCISNIPFTPRIKYNKTVLSPAQWTINLSNLEIKKDKSLKLDFDYFLHKFKLFIDEWNMPRYVFWMESDNRVLLDLENNIHMKILFENFLKQNSNYSLKLTEPIKNNKWILSNNNHYMGEIVIPFVKDIKYVKRTPTKEFNHFSLNHVKLNLEKNHLTKYPGSDWLYIKLYGHSNREEEFLAYYLKSICNEVMEKSLAEKYFFIRYIDKIKHIRLRFNGDPKVLYTKLLPFLYEKFVDLKNNGLLSSYVIDTYEPEVERYGGPELINSAETVFMYDSISVFEILNLIKDAVLNYDIEKIAVISILKYLDDFDLDLDEQISFMNNLVDYRQYLDDFRNDRNFFMKLGNAENEWENLSNDKNGEKLLDIFALRTTAIKTYNSLINELQKRNVIYNSKQDILASIIHMHCNRLLGLDRLKEKKVMTLARHTLHAIECYNRKSAKNLIRIESK